MGLTSFVLALSAQPTQVVVLPPEEGFPLMTISEEYLHLPYQSLLLDNGTSSGQVENLYTPRFLYHNGKTYFTYMMPQDAFPRGQIRLLVFDNERGVDVALTVGNVMIQHPIGVGDTHTVPSMLIMNDPGDSKDKIYIVQERTHMTPYDCYKSFYGDGDYGYFTFPMNIGVNLAYANIIQVGANALIWNRGGTSSGDANHLYSIFVVESTNYFEGLDTAVARRITLKAAQGLWHYPGVPFGHYEVDGRYYLLITRRTGQADGGTLPTPVTNEAYHKYYLVTTEDFITFTNFQQTFSHSTTVDGLITDTILQTNFMYHETDAIDTQGRIQAAGLSADGRFYAFCGSETGDLTWVFIYFDEDGTVVKKPVSIPDAQVIDVDADTNIFNNVMAWAIDDIRAIVYKTIGGFNRPHLIRSTDLGDTWTDLGDMCPEINDRSLIALIPNNIMQIPADTNFPLYFSYVATDATYRGLYCKLGVFGSLQPIPGVAVTAAVTMNYSSTGLFHYICTDAGLTNTGTNVTALIDQFGIRNATCANTPQWNSSDTVTFLSASSQKATPATPASLVNKNALTFFCVAKYTGASSILLSFTNTANTLSYIAFHILTANAAGVHPTTICAQFDTNTGVDTAIIVGQDDVDDGEFHVFSFVIDGRAMVILGVDGKDQYFSSNNTLTNTLEDWESIAKGPAGLAAAVNTVSIGARDRSTDNYADTTIKEMALFSVVMPTAERKSREKMLCDNYGITFQNQFQVPS